jgi:hypothetical protein
MTKLSKDIKTQPEVAQISDPRFTSQKFRNAVRLVLEFLSEEPNFGSFKKYDSASGSQFPINWVVFAKSLENPMRYATCFVRCNNPRVAPIGSRVQTPYGFLTETVALPGVTRDEALLKLDNKQYEFKEWRK